LECEPIATTRNSYKLKWPKSGTAKLSSVDEYIEMFPKDVQMILTKMRKTIQAAAPGSLEGISYGIPTFKLDGKNLVHFAGWKNHIGFYPAPSGMSAFSKELTPHKAGKGSVQFPLDKPIPFELVKRIVRSRVEEERKVSINRKSRSARAKEGGSS
jgi:uncharacterized protein YdhG (YjbR/CyaY superfamily)